MAEKGWGGVGIGENRTINLKKIIRGYHKRKVQYFISPLIKSAVNIVSLTSKYE